jgi:hypothetical protein
MSTIPPAYLPIITPLIDAARAILERGDELVPVAFVGSFTTGVTQPIMLLRTDAAAKEHTSRVIQQVAEDCAADFIFVMTEAWSLRKDQLPQMAQILARYGSIGASPYRVDIVALTLETRHGLWVAEVPIKPHEQAPPQRTFGRPDFQLFTEMEGCFTHLLPAKDGAQPNGVLH